MQPRKVFIGSSSESLGVAKALQENLEMNPGIECSIWNQGIFELSKGILDNLVDLLGRFDFAIFVFSTDDMVRMREKLHTTTRDNVVFETGLAMGMLGKERTFFIKPKNEDIDFRMPTDLLGLTFPEFDQKRFERGDEVPALAVASNKILREMSRFAVEKSAGPKEKLEELGINMSDAAGIFDQTGLTHAFQTRLEALPRMLEDIQNAKRSISMYARVYLSNLLKSPELADALATAVTSKAAAGSRFVVRNVSTDPEDLALVNQLYLFEDPGKRRWKTVDEYCRHLTGSNALYDEKYEDLQGKLARIEKGQRATVLFERHYLVNYLLPYSLLIVDDAIVYVSFYSLSSKRYGEFAPTMRLSYKSGDSERRWAYKFLQERTNIEEKYLKEGYTKPEI